MRTTRAAADRCGVYHPPMTEHPPLPTLWRTKLRSTIPGIDHSAQVRHCLDGGIVGIGRRLDDLPTGTPLDDVLSTIESISGKGWGKRAAQTVRRFGCDVQVGDFVWTRDTDSHYRLGRFLDGGYRYDNSEAATAVDVHQVRPVAWAPAALNDLDVPGAVVRAFTGTGSSFSRIWCARGLTPYLWAKHNGEPLPAVDFDARTVLTSLLDPYDVEDLIYVWMQVSLGYLAFPRARTKDQPAYEWTMLHRDTGRKAIVQVKTGGVHVDRDALAAAADDETAIFAFATGGGYDGSRDSPVVQIQPEELLAFVGEHPQMLPPRIRTWFELAKTG